MDTASFHGPDSVAGGTQPRLFDVDEYTQLTLPHIDPVRYELPPGVSRRSSVAVSVHEFHHVFGLPARREPSVDDVPDDMLRLRHRLLEEEVGEFAEAASRRDLLAMADALADIVYVAYGSAVVVGIDLDDVLAEVHRANMSKLDSRGLPLLREDGKVLKSESYDPPHIDRVLKQQRPLPAPRRRCHKSPRSSTGSPC